MRQVLDLAVEAGHLYANPARNATVTTLAKQMLRAARREKAERGAARIPTRVEFRSLVSAVRSAGVAECRASADYLEFIAYSGARKNEAAHVTWADVDFQRELICLRVTKNGEARQVPMVSEMKELLLRLRAERGLPAQDGSRLLRVREAQGFIDSACNRLGIARFTTHSLRHLFGTTCLEAGVDVGTVAGWLGHKDNGALLLKVYSHGRGQHEREMIKRVSFT